jgi:hypothetical protein
MGLAMDEQGNLRLLDILRGTKMAEACWRDSRESLANTDPASVAESPSQEAQPQRVLASPSGFCVICQMRTTATSDPGTSAVDAAPSENPASDEEGGTEQTGSNRSWLVFFDQSETLCALFPGIAARAARGDDPTALLIGLSKEDMKKLPDAPSEADASFDKQISRSRSASVRSGSLRGTSTTIRSGGVGAELGELTAANLQKIGRRQSEARKSALRSAASEGASQIGATMKTALPGIVAATQKGGVPMGWQAGVKQNLRRCLEEKNVRQAHLNRRMDAIRKELESS